MEAQEILKQLKPAILKMIRDETASCVKRKKMTIETPPHDDGKGNMVVTVTEAFGSTYDIPYTSALSSITKGETVQCEYSYSANNMIAVSKGNGQV